MRSLLLATVLAFSALVPATLQTAEACGGGYGSFEWQPLVHAVSKHGKGDTSVSFILLQTRLRDEAAAKLRFTQIDTMSFDTTATAPGGKFPTPVTLTLVGPAGTKVIKATELTWVDVAFEKAQPRAGVRIAGDYRIALEGEHPDATWEELERIHGSTVTVSSGAGTQLVSGHGSDTTTIGSIGKAVAGHPIGIVHVRGLVLAVMASRAARNTLSTVTL